MINKLIVSLVRLKFGLKKYERFQFENQKNKYDEYYFTDKALIKLTPDKPTRPHYSAYDVKLSGVSLNWLLNEECEIRKVGDQNDSI